MRDFLEGAAAVCMLCFLTMAALLMPAIYIASVVLAFTSPFWLAAWLIWG